jgi:uncharacterized protein
VWFFSLDASSAIAVAAARATYNLAYLNALIDFDVSDDAMPEIDFNCRREDPRGTMPANCHVRYAPIEGRAAPAPLGTIEFFLAERYILYSRTESHELYRARVHHQPYPLQRAELRHLEESLVWAAGIRRPDAIPLRHYAREVNVTVYPLERVT